MSESNNWRSHGGRQKTNNNDNNNDNNRGNGVYRPRSYDKWKKAPSHSSKQKPSSKWSNNKGNNNNQPAYKNRSTYNNKYQKQQSTSTVQQPPKKKEPPTPADFPTLSPVKEEVPTTSSGVTTNGSSWVNAVKEMKKTVAKDNKNQNNRELTYMDLKPARTKGVSEAMNNYNFHSPRKVENLAQGRNEKPLGYLPPPVIASKMGRNHPVRVRTPETLNQRDSYLDMVQESEYWDQKYSDELEEIPEE